MTSIRALLVAALVSIILAELFASFAVWHGQPTDTAWEPSFWMYELRRMQYWLPLIAAALACSLAIPNLSFRSAVGPKIAAGSFFLFCLFADYGASLLFRRSLSRGEAGLLGWSYEPHYYSLTQRES
jgi:hypothetical protein